MSFGKRITDSIVFKGTFVFPQKAREPNQIIVIYGVDLNVFIVSLQKKKTHKKRNDESWSPTIVVPQGERGHRCLPERF